MCLLFQFKKIDLIFVHLISLDRYTPAKQLSVMTQMADIVIVATGKKERREGGMEGVRERVREGERKRERERERERKGGRGRERESVREEWR